MDDNLNLIPQTTGIAIEEINRSKRSEADMKKMYVRLTGPLVTPSTLAERQRIFFLVGILTFL